MHDHTTIPPGQRLLARLRKLTDVTPAASAGPFRGDPHRPETPANVTKPAVPRATVYTPAALHESPPPHIAQLKATSDAHERLLAAIKAAPRFDPSRGPRPLNP